MKLVTSLVIFITIIIGFSVSCDPKPGWKPVSIEEQAIKAGIVLEGTSIMEEFNQYNNLYTVTLDNVKYFKSCGPTKVTVTGFRSSAACGVEPFGVGSRIIVFACLNSYNSQFADFMLNNIGIHTGATFWTDEINNKVLKALEVYGSVTEEECGEPFYLDCEA